MELTPQTLHAVEFREARRGGYNTRDVDDFLERVAAGVALLHDRLRDALARAEGAEGRLAEMQRQLDEVRRRPPAAPEVSETDDTLRRTLVLAQRTADATIKEAKDEAARLLSEAREEAAHIHAEIEAEARRGTEDARKAAEAEIEHLLDTRDGLRADLETLEQRVEEQRANIRAGISELERVLDDPVALQPVGAPPPPTDVERPPLPSRVEAPQLPPRVDPPRVDVSTTASGLPARNPALPMRKAPGDAETRNGQPTPEPAPVGSSLPAPVAAPPPAPAPSPFANAPAAPVAALQEAPPLPQRSRPAADLGAPTQPSPFVPFGGSAAGNGGTPWPSELRTSLEESPAGPGDDTPPPAPNGAREGVGIEPGSRPSEWGRPVFEHDDDQDEPHFHQR